MVDQHPEQTTYWERVSESRWGAYITEREQIALTYALDRLPLGTALEVGCEGGRWSAVVRDRGWDVVCTDVDTNSLARCAERIPSARCVQVSSTDETLPVVTGEVDLLLVYEVNEVVESDWFPREAARALRPGGMLVCSYWNAFSLRGSLYRTLARMSSRSVDGIRRFQGYYQGPKYGAFRNTLCANGLEPVREEGLCWFPFTRDSDSVAIPTAVAIEGAMRLRRLPTLSPWVLTVATRDGLRRWADAADTEARATEPVQTSPEVLHLE